MHLEKFKYIPISLIFLLFLSFPLAAETEGEKIGLVLSGGGALGMAHVGILKMIEKYEIPVDYITGTSMGAIVGALYASGYTASEIEKIINSIDWNNLLRDKIDRKYISISDRELFEKNIISLNFEKLKPKIPEGLQYGQNFYNFISSLTWHVKDITNFSNLPIPFKCIATDLQTGEAVVLEKGNLVDAVRASMAIPSVFSAIDIEGRLLVDGGIVRNIPVSDIKDMGADIIIVSDVSPPGYRKEEINSLTTVMNQVFKITLSTSDDYEKSLADLVITHDLKEFNISSFSNSTGIIAAGEKAALENEEYFKQLSSEINRKNKITIPPKDKPVKIDRITISGNTRISDQKILKQLDIKENDMLTNKKLHEAVAYIYGTGDYNLIRYSIDSSNKYNTLNIRINESPKQIVSFGINYNNYDNASFLINTTVKDFIIDSSKIRFKTKLSENYLFNLRYSIPILFGFFDLGADGEIYRKDFYNYDSKGDKTSKIFSDFYSFSFFLEHSFLNSIKAALSWKKNYINMKDDISLYEVEENLSYTSSGLYTAIDTLNRPVYPEKGVNIQNYLEYISVSDYFSDTTLGDEKDIDNYIQVKSKTDIYIPVSNFLTLNTSALICLSGLENRDSIGFFAGGFKDDLEKNFVGFTGLFPGDIREENIAVIEAGLSIYLRKNLVTRPFYSTLIYDIIGNYKDIYSYGLSLALITPIGPIEIAGAKAESKDFPVIYFNIGFNF